MIDSTNAREGFAPLKFCHRLVKKLIYFTLALPFLRLCKGLDAVASSTLLWVDPSPSNVRSVPAGLLVI